MQPQDSAGKKHGNSLIKTLSKPLVEKHMAALIAIAADVPNEYWTEEHFFAERPRKWELSFGVWKERLVGYAILSQSVHVHIHHFMIARPERNRGLGKIMIEEAITRAGDTPLTLKVHKDNHGAIRFYQRHGFVKTNENEYIFMQR